MCPVSLPRMGRSVLGLVILVVAMAPGCEGGSTGATTTPTRSEKAFKDSLCGANRSLLAANTGAAETFKLATEAYDNVKAPPAREADLGSMVTASRALAALWSDISPTTAETFSARHQELAGTFNAAAERLRIECPKQRSVTTSVAAPFWTDKSVHRSPERPTVLFWFFHCPKGITLKYGAGVFPQRGGAGIVVDEAAGVTDPFTGVLANESYGRVAEMIKAACV